MPQKTPDMVGSLRAKARASSELTVIISATFERTSSKTFGTNPAPMPWIVCGPGLLRTAAENGRLRGLDGDDFDGWRLLVEKRRDPRQRAPRADT